MPSRLGKVGLAYFLSENGNVSAEATLALIENDHLWYGSAAAAELHDWDWLHERLPGDSPIRIESLTNDMTALVIAGPKSRALLGLVCPREDWSSESFPWLSVRRCMLGHFEAVVMSVSFCGELGYELHLPNQHLVGVYELLRRHGKPSV